MIELRLHADRARSISPSSSSTKRPPRYSRTAHSTGAVAPAPKSGTTIDRKPSWKLVAQASSPGEWPARPRWECSCAIELLVAPAQRPQQPARLLGGDDDAVALRRVVQAVETGDDHLRRRRRRRRGRRAPPSRARAELRVRASRRRAWSRARRPRSSPGCGRSSPAAGRAAARALMVTSSRTPCSSTRKPSSVAPSIRSLGCSTRVVAPDAVQADAGGWSVRLITPTDRAVRRPELRALLRAVRRVDEGLAPPGRLPVGQVAQPEEELRPVEAAASACGRRGRSPPRPSDVPRAASRTWRPSTA